MCNLTHSTRAGTTVTQTISEVPATKKGGAGQEPYSAMQNIAIVQCDGFRCLAYRDANTWRDLQNGRELPAVMAVIHSFQG